MSANPSWQIIGADEQYISSRVIDAFLREDIRGILSQGQLIHDMQGLELVNHWPLALPQSWLCIDHLGDFILWLPLQASHFIQDWRLFGHAWLLEQQGQFYGCNHYTQWLEQVSAGLNEDQRVFYWDYISECRCAVEHRKLAMDLFVLQQVALNCSISSLSDGWSQMALIEQLAAHLDHPLYPTARAKFGLNSIDVERYCPESMHSFALNWLAVPNNLCVNSIEQVPIKFPSFSQVGLSQALALSHQLIPVHPLTYNDYLPLSLIHWSHTGELHFAPLPYLMVRATLSVRTVVVLDDPSIHIKLPLPMRTLGSKNIRTIKPSTINDGFVFQQLLQYLERSDEGLNGLYLHSHEQQGGHVDQRADLAWLVRQYPPEMAETTPVCVAALLAANPNGELVIEQLAHTFYQGNLDLLLQDYFGLLLKVHLRLWLVYGIGLEANQQNTVLLFAANQPLRLLFRDNDAGRIYPALFTSALFDGQQWLDRFIDRRILVAEQESLLQLFTTITLQLNIGCIIEGLGQRVDSKAHYVGLTRLLQAQIQMLQAQGIATDYLEQMLLLAPKHHAKYLLSAGSLLSKNDTGALDINKFYGFSAPNVLNVG